MCSSDLHEIGSRLTSYVAAPLSTDTGRLVIWTAGWKLVQLAPIAGNGLGLFALLYTWLQANDSLPLPASGAYRRFSCGGR